MFFYSIIIVLGNEYKGNVKREQQISEGVVDFVTFITIDLSGGSAVCCFLPSKCFTDKNQQSLPYFSNLPSLEEHFRNNTPESGLSMEILA